MTGSTGIAATLAASLLVLFRLGQSVFPGLIGGTAGGLWTMALKHLIACCLIPLLAGGLLQFFKRPSARFVLGSGTTTGHVLLSVLLGSATALMMHGLALLLSRTFSSWELQIVPPLLRDAIVPFQSSPAAHALVLLLGVLLSTACLSLLCFGYVAPCLDIGWHRTRAVLGTALFFALAFGSLEILPAMLITGFLLAIVRLNTDSLFAAAAAFGAYLLIGFFGGTIEARLSVLFFGQTRLDAGHTYSLALIMLLSGAALLVPSFVFLSGMWREQHTERLREALSAAGNKALPEEPDRSVDFPFILAVVLLAAALIIK